MPNGPPNPWSESNSPSLRQNQGGSVSARSVDAVIDQRPGQPELSHAAFQLDRRPGRVLQRQGRKTAEPKGVISSFRRRFRLKSSRPTAVSPPWW
ncbi:Uncharacterised protein [Mycobacteroides abscessus subsp. abscessus]|nr:Uncharacterised protein [Mycobacteroides abscessus subsp. abscessus]